MNRTVSFALARCSASENLCDLQNIDLRADLHFIKINFNKTFKGGSQNLRLAKIYDNRFFHGNLHLSPFSFAFALCDSNNLHTWIASTQRKNNVFKEPLRLRSIENWPQNRKNCVVYCSRFPSSPRSWWKKWTYPEIEYIILWRRKAKWTQEQAVQRFCLVTKSNLSNPNWPIELECWNPPQDESSLTSYAQINNLYWLYYI